MADLYICKVCGSKFETMPENHICPICLSDDIVEIGDTPISTKQKIKHIIIHPIENGVMNYNIFLYPQTIYSNIVDDNKKKISEDGVFKFGKVDNIYFVQEGKKLSELLTGAVIPNPEGEATEQLTKLKIADTIYSVWVDLIDDTTPKANKTFSSQKIDSTYTKIDDSVSSLNTTYSSLKIINRVVDNINSDDSTRPLSANMGRMLNERINTISVIGRFLAIWNASTGLPYTNPPSPLPYTYHTGDYFIVSNVGSVNYKPEGLEYTGAASTTVETDTTLHIGDLYYFDGTNWNIMHLQTNQFILENVYPVGSVYISFVNVSPAPFLGGTWERVGQGKMLVGVDETDTDFNAPNKTGGEKTHTLTINEMPSHSHDKPANGYFCTQPFDVEFQVGHNQRGLIEDYGDMLNTGGDQPHNNMPPYLTVYMWRRTA